MLKKTSTIIFFLVVSLCAFAVYDFFKIPEGVTPQSNQSETSVLISFWTSIATMIAAIFGVIGKIIDLKKRNSDD